MSAKMHISKSFQLLLISLSGPAAWNSLSLICTTCTETEVLKMAETVLSNGVYCSSLTWRSRMFCRVVSAYKSQVVLYGIYLFIYLFIERT